MHKQHARYAHLLDLISNSRSYDPVSKLVITVVIGEHELCGKNTI